MPKKAKELEEEIQVSQQPKKETFASRWFKENCKDDVSDILKICELTARSAAEQFEMYLRSNNTEIFAIIFFGTFQAILEFLRDKQRKGYQNFTVEIANSINIGYSNSTDTENEKVGNFMPIMEYIGVNRNIVNSESGNRTDRTTQNFILWKQLNVKKNVENFKEIQERAYNKLLEDYRIDLRSSEAVIPLFCIFMDNINSVLRMKYLEADGTQVSEVSMRVLGLFDAFYSFDEESGKEFYEYQPSVFFKLSLKNDSVAVR